MNDRPSLLTVLWRYVMRQLLGNAQITQSPQISHSESSQAVRPRTNNNPGYNNKTYVTSTNLITAFEFNYDGGKLTQQSIDSYQEEADRLFNEATNGNPEYNGETYKILEFQALIYKARGQDREASKTIHDAHNIMPKDAHFVSKAAQNWVKVLAGAKTPEYPPKYTADSYKTPPKNNSSLEPVGEEMIANTRIAQFSSWDEPQLWNG